MVCCGGSNTSQQDTCQGGLLTYEPAEMIYYAAANADNDESKAQGDFWF